MFDVSGVSAGFSGPSAAVRRRRRPGAKTVTHCTTDRCARGSGRRAANGRATGYYLCVPVATGTLSIEVADWHRRNLDFYNFDLE